MREDFSSLFNKTIQTICELEPTKSSVLHPPIVPNKSLVYPFSGSVENQTKYNNWIVQFFGVLPPNVETEKNIPTYDIDLY